MESKKINQLATELAPALSDLTIIGDPTTGISKKITLSQMASLFTGTVEEYANIASFPLVGVPDTIYIALDTNVLYRWDTGLTSYVELSPNIINSLVFNDANGFDGTISLVGSVATLTITTALTTGSVGFIGASGALLQDNANFFWDDTNNRLGLGTNAPTTAIDVFGSGIIGRLNGTSTNNAFLGFASAGSNKWSIGNVQADHRFRIYNEATTSELVSVLQTGEFGIGIANPTTKLHIDGGASALIANLDANVSVAKSISFRSDNSNRINLEVSGTESGSNAGANFFIRRYSDAGALIDTPLTITRSTGAITLATALSGTSATFNTNSTSNAGVFQINDATTTLGNSFATVHRNANDGNGRFSLSRWQVQNTSGLNQSAFIGAQAVTGAANYSPNLILGVSNGASSYTTYLTIASTGAATFSSSVSVNGASATTALNVSAAGANGINLAPDTNSPTTNSARLYFSNNSTAFAILNSNSTLSFTYGATAGSGTGTPGITMTSTGNVGIGTTSPTRSLQITRTSTAFINAEGSIVAFGSSDTELRLFGNNTETMTLKSGNVGIGTISPSYKLHIVGTTTDNTAFSTVITNSLGETILAARNDKYIYVPGVYINTTGSAANVHVTSGGDLIRSTSSLKYKKEVKDYDKGLAEVMSMRPVYYKGKGENDGDIQFAGLIAEEVHDLGLTEYVQYAEDGTPDALAYQNMVAILIKGVQELKAELDILKNK